MSDNYFNVSINVHCSLFSQQIEQQTVALALVAGLFISATNHKQKNNAYSQKSDH